MSIEAVTFYKVVCDHEGCGRATGDLSDFAAWADHGQAADDWENGDGWIGANGETFCYEHRPALCVWCGELATGKDADDEDICPDHAPGAAS